MKATCAYCKEEHDLEHLDPSFGLPDEAFAVPVRDRGSRVIRDKDFCLLRGTERNHFKKYYLRTLLEVQVAGRLRPFRWGIWVEVQWSAFDEVMSFWNQATRVDAKPWGGSLANTIPGFPETRALLGSLRFRNLIDITYFTLSDGDHPLILDQRNGVPQERAVEWLLNTIHGHGGVSS